MGTAGEVVEAGLSKNRFVSPTCPTQSGRICIIHVFRDLLFLLGIHSRTEKIYLKHTHIHTYTHTPTRKQCPYPKFPKQSIHYVFIFEIFYHNGMSDKSSWKAGTEIELRLIC